MRFVFLVLSLVSYIGRLSSPSSTETLPHGSMGAVVANFLRQGMKLERLANSSLTLGTVHADKQQTYLNYFSNDYPDQLSLLCKGLQGRSPHFSIHGLELRFVVNLSEEAIQTGKQQNRALARHVLARWRRLVCVLSRRRVAPLPLMQMH